MDRRGVIDWGKTVGDLHTKFSDGQIARMSGLCRHTVMEIRKGRTKEPRYGAGCKLLEIHYRHFRVKDEPANGTFEISKDS